MATKNGRPTSLTNSPTFSSPIPWRPRMVALRVSPIPQLFPLPNPWRPRMVALRVSPTPQLFPHPPHGDQEWSPHESHQLPNSFPTQSMATKNGRPTSLTNSPTLFSPNPWRPRMVAPRVSPTPQLFPHPPHGDQEWSPYESFLRPRFPGGGLVSKMSRRRGERGNAAFTSNC